MGASTVPLVGSGWPWARATSRRSPSRPSGTGRSRCSAIDLASGPAVDVDAENREAAGEDCAAHDRRVGEIEDRPMFPVRAEDADPVDDMTAKEPGRAE